MDQGHSIFRLTPIGYTRTGLPIWPMRGGAEGAIAQTSITDLPRSSYAYCEPDNGPCHFPIKDKDGKPDAAHVRNALARLSQSPFGDKARPAVEAAARALGIGAPAHRSEMATPHGADAFKEHLAAPPPDGHGEPVATDYPADALRSLHDEKHALAAEHSHPGGMVSGRSELSDGSFLVRTMPPTFTYDDGESVRAADLRDEGDSDTSPGYLTGRFAVFDVWTEVRSAIEGNFMERTGESAFRKTLSEGRPPILFQHGWDSELGTRPIAPTEEVGTDTRGGFYGGPLLKGVPELVVSGLRAGLYGSSYRFRAVKPEVIVRPRPSGYNPRGIPEVTVREATLKELGPGMFPVYVGTTAKVRSETDDYLLSRFGDPEQLRSFIVANGGMSALHDDGAGSSHSDDRSRSTPPHEEPPTQPSRFRSRDEWLDYLKERANV